MPVTAQNMSYVSVVATGLVVFVVSLWFTTKRGVFKGPKIDMALLIERRNAAIQGEVIAAVEVSPKTENDAVGDDAKDDKTSSF